MKKGWIALLIIAIIIAGYFIFFNKTTSTDKEPKQQPLAQSVNSDSFNTPFNDLLNQYFILQTALVNWDTAKASACAKSLADLASKVNYSLLKADTSIIETAQNYSDTIISNAKHLQQDTSLTNKRYTFNILTDNLYNLIRTVHYDQQIIYHDKCPMAFGDNNEGYWLSNARQIINPYFGNKHPKYHSGMMTCGDIVDSIDFVKK